ncbi:MAG: hypothetical protein KAJ37_12025, partial [Candidatus Krumholzibacteria bacterium]|nr:hypothetical protein [Candidatus Krumholzibacteria bacterium]
VEFEDDVQGQSFRPLFDGDDMEIKYLYFDDVQEHDQTDALIESSYKLITLKNGGFELYELIADPREEINFASRNPKMVQSMIQKILTMRDENVQRRVRNLAALGDSLDLMSEQEKRIILKKLKALGYVQ